MVKAAFEQWEFVDGSMGVLPLIRVAMLICYVRSGCPFSAKALRAIEETGAPVEIRNIGDESVFEELLERGGRDQVPFLWGDDGEVNIYESDTIVRYLTQRFSENSAS